MCFFITSLQFCSIHLFFELRPTCILENSDVVRDRKRLSMAGLYYYYYIVYLQRYFPLLFSLLFLPFLLLFLGLLLLHFLLFLVFLLFPCTLLLVFSISSCAAFFSFPCCVLSHVS
uniref:Uncharacterized protein n=1 Tax=Cacopsylla melanoneura TaxID=428564 RepID=A0A8D8VML6_9HEMI